MVDWTGTGAGETVTGGSGDDVLNGMGGNDTLSGAGGNDRLMGGEGNDILSGGDGDDILEDKAGVLNMSGGAGNDTFTFIERPGGTNPNWNKTGVIDGGSGTDTIDLGYYGWTGANLTGVNLISVENLIVTHDLVTLTRDQLVGFASIINDQTSSNLNYFNFAITTAGFINWGVEVTSSSFQRLEAQVSFSTGADWTGRAGSDEFNGGVGNDIFRGEGGGDYLNGNSGNDTLSGGDGDDWLDGGAGTDVLSGGAGVDRLYDEYAPGTPINFDGGSGNDIMEIRHYNSSQPIMGTVRGGDGYDELKFTGASQVIITDALINEGPAAGDIEWLNISNGGRVTANVGQFSRFTDIGNKSGGSFTLVLADTATFLAPLNLSAKVLSNTTATVNAGGGSDWITGHAGTDIFYGAGGDDTLYGLDGYDTLFGGEGHDDLFGGGGDDTLYGENGSDLLEGGAGQDDLQGGSGLDVLNGGDGNDRLSGGTENDTLNGGAGTDWLNGGAGADQLNGGDGIDTASYEGSSAGVTVLLAGQTASGGHATGDTLSGIENVIGSGYDDVLRGDGAANVLTGGAGADLLTGGAGDDILIGGAGDDRMVGGLGMDTASFANATAAVTVDLSVTTRQRTGGDGRDIIQEIENLIGSAFNDVLRGDVGDNVIRDGAGNNRLEGMDGADTLTVDLSYISSGAFTSRLDGGDGDDVLTFLAGAAQQDTGVLLGGAGNDTISATGLGVFTLDAGDGDDHVTISPMSASAYTIFLGAGSDTLTLAAAELSTWVDQSHVVRDFQTGAGGDVIDMTALLGGLTGFSAGSNPFASGHARLIQNGQRTLLQVDRDGGGDGYVTLLTFNGTSVGGWTAYNLGGLDPNGAAAAVQDVSKAEQQDAAESPGLAQPWLDSGFADVARPGFDDWF